MSLHVGMDRHYFIETTTSATPDFPTADIISAVFKVRKPNGQQVDWPTVITAQSASSITLRHYFDAAGAELDQAGPGWHLYALATTSDPAKHPRTEEGRFEVLP